MQKALVSDLSTIDKFKRLLAKANNDLSKLLLLAATDPDCRLDCLAREFDAAWQLELVQLRKNPQNQILIPVDTIPAFYSCALIILNARDHKQAVKQYLEILAAAPYFSFHAAKLLAEGCIELLSYDKENSRKNMFEIIDQARQYAADAAQYHLTPGYLLLASMHFQSGKFLHKVDKISAVAHYEFTYKNLLIAQALQPYSATRVSNAYQDKGFSASNEWGLDSVESLMVQLLHTLKTSEVTIVTDRARHSADNESKSIIEDLEKMHDSDEETTSLQFF